MFDASKNILTLNMSIHMSTIVTYITVHTADNAINVVLETS